MVNSSVRASPQVFLPGKYFRLSSLLLFIALLLTLTVRSTFAQDNTLYLMPDIPQANQLNPALFKLCRIYVELPVISSVKVNIRNTGFGFHDVIDKGTGSQSDTYFLNLTKLDGILKKTNYAQVETDINLLGFGFGFKDWYFTFGISNHSDLLLSYPHDIVLLRDENLPAVNSSGTPVAVNNPGGEITLWNSIGISAATEIRDGLKIGVRVKYLQGMANVVSQGSDIFLNPLINPVSLQTLMISHINTSFPVSVGFLPNGKVNNIYFDNARNNIAGDFIFNGNRGTAIDAGVVYDPNDKTEISASFTDLGFIHWKKNIHDFNATVKDLFNAGNLAQFQLKTGQIDFVKTLRDSVSRAFTASTKSYFTLTPVKIFAGVTRLISPGLRAGAMTRIEIYDLHVMPSLTLSMNYTPIPLVAASLSYTIMNNKFNQVGAGLAVGNRGAQFYIITDNIPLRYTKAINSPLYWPYNARMVSLRFGLNLLFGCNQKENKFHVKNRKDTCPAYW